MRKRQALLGLLGVAAFGGLVLLERRDALREEQVEPKGRRVLRNLAVAGASAAAVQLAERPVVLPVAEQVERRRWGLLPRLGLPRPLEIALAVVLTDYDLYWWHVLLHRMPLLWRAHAVHHADLGLDASTALRFHFTEMLASVPFRSAQVLLVGVRPRAYRIWSTATICSVLFHHSNIRLPLQLERFLCRLVMTPRLHGIHHSIVPEEMDSNFSSGLALWDIVHHTARRNVRQEEIEIGVAALRQPDEVTLPRIMAMPFHEQEDLLRLPGDGRPVREPSAAPAARLLP
jgi:sterol desaturase/sphingolipid hydroxylase (fatty acid hydroxylase superfamily)